MNIFEKSTEKFVKAFEESFTWKNWIFSEYSIPILSFIFFTSPFFFLLLLTNNLTGVSYGHSFLATQRARLGKSFKYFPKSMRSRENFLETFGNEVAIQKVSFCHAQNEVKGWIQLFPDFFLQTKSALGWLLVII